MILFETSELKLVCADSSVMLLLKLLDLLFLFHNDILELEVFPTEVGILSEYITPASS